MYDIWVSLILSATIATAPEVCPTNLSPIIRSLVLLLGPLNVDSITVGANGWIFGLDASYTPSISTISELFREMISSWTLVPYG